VRRGRLFVRRQFMMVTQSTVVFFWSSWQAASALSLFQGTGKAGANDLIGGASLIDGVS